MPSECAARSGGNFGTVGSCSSGSRRHTRRSDGSSGDGTGGGAPTAGGKGIADPRSSVAETLADYAVRLRYGGSSADVVRTVKRTILDTIGCAIGGYEAGPSRIAIKLAADVNATPGATVFCSGIKTSHELAVFANGVMIRYLDFNDGYITPMGGGHPERHPCCPHLLGRDRRGVGRWVSMACSGAM